MLANILILALAASPLVSAHGKVSVVVRLLHPFPYSPIPWLLIPYLSSHPPN